MESKRIDVMARIIAAPHKKRFFPEGIIPSKPAEIIKMKMKMKISEKVPEKSYIENNIPNRIIVPSA